MSDYISRETLLSAVAGYDWEAGLKTVLKRIPAADVRPVKRGEWIRTSHRNCMGYKCSICGAIYNKRKSRLNYYPNCGAEMRRTDNV